MLMKIVQRNKRITMLLQGQAIIDQTTQPTMSNDEIENTINKIKQKLLLLRENINYK